MVGLFLRNQNAKILMVGLFSRNPDPKKNNVLSFTVGGNLLLGLRNISPHVLSSSYPHISPPSPSTPSSVG